MSQNSALAQRLRSIVLERYPGGLTEKALRNLERQAFEADVVSSLVPGGAICDIGGGLGLFPIGCAVAGMSVTVVDDFTPIAERPYEEEVFSVHASLGIDVKSRDVLQEGLGVEAASFDVVSCIGTIEHFHHSPKALLAEVVQALRPGGWFFLGAPNCANLRKRVQAVVGSVEWSSMADWYEQPRFIGHVREPSVPDLRYIADDMGLRRVRVIGRNTLGLVNESPWVRALTGLGDRVLRCRPSLCSDIYLLGQRPPGKADH